MSVKKANQVARNLAHYRRVLFNKETGISRMPEEVFGIFKDRKGQLYTKDSNGWRFIGVEYKDS